MTQDKHKIARNTGKVEFLANIERIQTMNNAGYNLSNIHKILTDESKFTMSLLTFRYHFRKYKKDIGKKSNIAQIVKTIANQTISPAVPSKAIHRTTSNAFESSVNVDIEQLY